jgi:DNA-binding transcriptional ArsR family regulator
MPKKQNEEETWIFSRVSSPNTTQVPDQYLDELLPILSGAELKVLLYITRRTFGFKKDSDNISLSQMLRGITTRDGRILDRGTGLSKPTLLQALRSLQDKHIIETECRRSPEKGDEPTVYKLKFAEGPAGQKPSSLVKKLTRGGKEISPGGWSKDLTTQQTVLQQADINHSNTRKASPKNDKTTAVHGEPETPRHPSTVCRRLQSKA